MDISNNAMIIIIAILGFGIFMIYEGISTSETLTALGGIGSIILGIVAVFTKAKIGGGEGGE